MIFKQFLYSLNMISHDLKIVYNNYYSYLKNSKKIFFIQQLLIIIVRFTLIYIILNILDEYINEILEEIIILIHQIKDSEIKVFYIFHLNFIDIKDHLNVSRIYSIDIYDKNVRNYLSI